MDFMSRCYLCGKEPLTKNEIGLTRKLLNEEAVHFYCLECLAEFLEVDAEFLVMKIEDFKNQGCIYF